MLHTADLCDRYFPDIQVAAPGLRHFGGRRLFDGSITTVKVNEDSALIKSVMSEPGNGGVLVIDGGGSLQRALTGENMAAMAQGNGWNGLVFNGCVRDADQLAALEIGILALGSCPVRPAQTGAGDRGIDLEFCNVRFAPGHFLYADGDGLIVSEHVLTLGDTPI